MTRETRIGLVVGLLFIVMFALVLSDLTGADSYLPTESLGGVRYLDEDGPIIEVIDSFTSRPVPPRTDAPPADVKPVESPHASAPPEANDAHRAPPSLSAVTDPELPDDDAHAEPAAAPREDRGPREIERPGPVEAAGTIRPFARPDARARPGTGTYIVKPGDTLTRIARKMLNDDSPSAIRRISEANAGRLDDPDFLRIGLELVIPSPPPAAPTAKVRSAYYRSALADLDRELKKRQALSAERPTHAIPTAPASARRLYKVRRGDNLTKIAREMLRDARPSAVRKILNANKDKIQNPDVLPIGVELVIPS